MRRFLLLPLLFAPVLSAEGPEFEVASIKPFGPRSNDVVMIGPGRGGPGTADPTHISMSGTPLKFLLGQAFDVKAYQIAGPDILDSERFDIAVVVPEGATKDDVKIMWRNLLISRFGMKYHIEQKEFSVDELVVGPRGHKLIENKDAPPPAPDPAAPPAAFAPPKLDAEGRPILNAPGLFMMMSRGPSGTTARATAKAQPISGLVTMLSNQIGHPVVDKTGLTGKYDFSLEYFPTSLPGLPPGMQAPPAPPANSPTPNAPDLGLDLATAIQQQLGLRLVSGKGMLDVIAVDEIQATPTEN